MYEKMVNLTSFREMQIKTTMRYHFKAVRRAPVDKTSNNTCRRGCGAKGTLIHCRWECKLIQPLWKMIWWFLRKLKIELPFDSADCLLGIYPQILKRFICKAVHNPMFIAALFTVAKMWKCPCVDDWRKKMGTYVFTMEYYSA